MNKTIFTFEKLYEAYLDCRKSKRKTINALEFEWDLENNLFHLQKDLKRKEYRPGCSICFVVREPSPREIFAATFRDRVVHHFLIREIEGIGEKSFIYDSFSCRKGKGTHLAVKRLKDFIRKATRNRTERAFYLQLDISGFFMSIDHNILYMILRNLILRQNRSRLWKESVLWLAKAVIFHKPTSDYVVKGDPDLFKLIPHRKSLFYSGERKGLPIGNYSSQFFANLYLNKLDQFVKRELKCKYYVRYVDDLILLDRSETKLKRLKEEIGPFLKNNLHLELNLKKIWLKPISSGIDFLGYFIKSDYCLVRRKIVGRFKEKLYPDEKLPDSGEALSRINSYYGHFKHAFSYNLRKSVYEHNSKGAFKKLFPENNYSFLRQI